MKPTCGHCLFLLLWSIVCAVMLGSTALTSKPSPVFGLLVEGVLISFGFYWVRHRQEDLQAQFLLFALTLSAALIALALTDKSPLVVGLLSGGPFILLGIHWIRHKQEVAQAHLFRPFNTPGYVFFMGMLAILMGALAVIGGAVGALQQACRCF